VPAGDQADDGQAHDVALAHQRPRDAVLQSPDQFDGASHIVLFLSSAGGRWKIAVGRGAA
jgi:hypothetical protein